MAVEFHLRKLGDSLAQFTPGRRLFAGSEYRLVVDAPEFAADAESAATAYLTAGGARVAYCALVPDPLRRGLRVSETPLLIPAEGADDPRIVVDLDGNTILSVDVPVDGWASGGAASVPRWTVVDLGQVSGAEVTVADMTQVRLAAPQSSSPLSVVPEDPSGPFDAYLVVDGVSGFPFSGVLVGGAAPTWRHQDSLLLPASRWILHVVKVAGAYFADLHAGRPAGAEVDPDGAVVVSAEVNS